MIENEVQERKEIDYKQFLPGSDDSSKIEFLADITSFANAGGGYLIYGIKEMEGIPKEISGLEINPDLAIQRFENICRDGIEPRIRGLKIHPVKLENSKYSIIISIPRSWIIPHRIRFKENHRFYSRNSNGKYLLDISEVRGLFSLSVTIIEKIKNFRAERLFAIVNGETPIRLEGRSRIILHIIAMSAFDPSKGFDLTALESVHLFPIDYQGSHSRFNLEGLLFFQSDSYLQIFRNGIIEAVNSTIINDEKMLIPSLDFERQIISSLSNFVSFQKKLGVEPPLICMLTIVGVKGYNLGIRDPFALIKKYPIDREILSFPEVMIENLEFNAAKIMKPIFDALWNSVGLAQSQNYDKNGNWREGRS